MVNAVFLEGAFLAKELDLNFDSSYTEDCLLSFFFFLFLFLGNSEILLFAFIKR